MKRVVVGAAALFAAGITVVGTSTAQEGYSGAAAARARYLANRGVLPSASEIAIDEFLNYHRHKLTPPRAGEPVALDLRWDRIDDDDDRARAVLQIGFATARVHDRSHLRPINLCLVIDKSGSMADQDKMERVKEGLEELVDRLRPSDTVSVVAYDTRPRVVLEASEVGNRRAVRRAIRSLEPGGSTNLHGGLMLGYREVRRHFDAEATNRVILLTDGIANRGCVDPEQIVEDSSEFNRRGVDLSTIGVGMNINRVMLKQLAESGRGLHHFIADGAEINKVFIDEVQSLFSPVARDVELEVSWPDHLELATLHGIEDAKVRGHRARIHLDDMNHGLTQVLLLEFRALDPEDDVAAGAVRVELEYRDVESNREVELTRRTRPRPTDGELADPEVRKNWTIAQLATAIKKVARAGEKSKWRAADRTARRAIRRAEAVYPNGDDADVERVLDILRKYRRIVERNLDC